MRRKTVRLALLLLFSLAIALVTVIQQGRGLLRIDLTEDKLYTLSEGTLNTLASLQSPVELELFFTDQATRDFPVLRNYKRRVTELLQEYVLMSGGKLSLIEVDPKPFSEAEDRAASLGLTPAALSPGMPAVYFGLAATGDREQAELIPFFQPGEEAALEQAISKAVLLAGRDSAPKIAILSSLEIDGGFDPLVGRPISPWIVTQQLRELAEVQWLPLDTAVIPSDSSALLLIHPSGLSEQTRYAVDQYIMRGGNAAVFLDPLAENLSSSGTQPEPGTTASDLPELLSAWGLTMIADKVVGDAQYAVAVPNRTGTDSIRHLGLYQLRGGSTDKPIVGGLEVFNLASAGALRQAVDAPMQFTPLLLSSRNSGLLDTRELEFLFDPVTLYDDFSPTGEQYTLAAMLRGKPNSAFPDGPPTEFEAAGVTPAPHLAEAERDSIIVVVADTDMLLDQMWVHVQDFFGQRVAQPFADNGNFFMNTIDTLLGNADLVGLRARGQHHRPFHVVQRLERDADSRFRAKERELTARLSETETRLAALQASKSDEESLVLSKAQRATIAEFEAEKLSIRKQLRAVKLQLREDIDALENRLKLINIVVAPVVLTLLLYLFVLLRRKLKRSPF